MKFFYGLSVGILLTGETFAEKCETFFNLTANKCMEVGCLGPESCMHPATLGEYLDLKKPAEFAVKCIKNEACECDASRGYGVVWMQLTVTTTKYVNRFWNFIFTLFSTTPFHVQTDKTNKLSICTPPTKKCTDTTGKYEEYKCGENVCTCKTKNFDYCASPDNYLHNFICDLQSSSVVFSRLQSQGVQTSSGGANMPKIIQNLKNPQNCNAFYLVSSFSGGEEGRGVIVKKSTGWQCKWRVGKYMFFAKIRPFLLKTRPFHSKFTVWRIGKVCGIGIELRLWKRVQGVHAFTPLVAPKNMIVDPSTNEYVCTARSKICGRLPQFGHFWTFSE